ncbi:alpha-L-fucosidase [Sinomicrobium sp. M5D2P9]
MKRRDALKTMSAAAAGLYFSNILAKEKFFGDPLFSGISGPFEPTWDSLMKYEVPQWFRDAKFGIWAHWGPQCAPEKGDWYARGMYQEGSEQYKYHLEHYGHPSKFGFKDIIHSWKADQWNPDELVGLYKKAGARYFMAMANHHDNLDLYDSTYQSEWNSVKRGPKKDIVKGWAQAAKKYDLPFAVSVHAAHAWSWFETAQRSDTKGPMAGVPYDGKLNKADGKGLWWEGLDPQDLYAQNHPLSENSLDNGMIHKQWNWENGVAEPSQAYMEKFYNRTKDLLDKYHPEMVYFDDTALPFWPVSDVGLRLAAYMYNKSIRDHGELKAVINGKILSEDQRQAMVWDIERGQSNTIEPLPWQTCTCIGSWHYDREIYNRKGYKSAQTVIHTLIDVVSKNGNLMLNIPVRGNGSIDEQEKAIVEETGRWMELNSESIYGTRPWKIFGEGPQQESAGELKAQGFNEGKGLPFSYKDVRFVTKGDDLYATVMGWPELNKVVIKSLSSKSKYRNKKIRNVRLVSTGQDLSFRQTAEGLVVDFPENKVRDFYANPLKIS